MKTAAQMSLEIRRKKKAMQADPAVVDLSGIPMDKTDEDIMEQEQLTTKLDLDTNHPKERSEEPDDMADKHSPPHEEMASDPELDEMKMKRKSRIQKMIKG